MANDDYASILNSSAQVLSSAVNYAAASSIDKETRRYNREMYDKQRADSLADWTMQNDYNHPSAQMARLRAAGLNPNLVYGNGADATATSMPRGTEAKSWSPPVPRFDVSGPLMSMYDIRMKEAQTDNLRTQNTLLQQDGMLKGLMASKLATETARSKFDLDLASDMREYSLEALKEHVRRLRIGTDIGLQENERREAMNASNLREAVTRIAKMRADTMRTNLETSQSSQMFPLRKQQAQQQIQVMEQNLRSLLRRGVLEELDVRLANKGIRPGSPAWDNALKGVLDALNFRGAIDAAGQGMDDFNNWLERVLPWGNQ